MRPHGASGTQKWRNLSCWAVQCRMSNKETLALFESWICRYFLIWIWSVRFLVIFLRCKEATSASLPPHTSKLCEFFDMFKIMIHKHGKISEILKYSSHSAQMMEYIRQSCITMLLMWIMLCWCIYLALYLGQFYDKQLLNIMNTRMISRSFNTNVKLGSKLHGLWELYFVNECCFKQSYFSKCSCFDK